MNSNRLYILICSTNTRTHIVFSSEKVWIERCATIVNFFICVVIGLCLEYHLLDIGPCSMMNTLNHFYVQAMNLLH